MKNKEREREREREREKKKRESVRDGSENKAFRSNLKW